MDYYNSATGQFLFANGSFPSVVPADSELRSNAIVWFSRSETARDAALAAAGFAAITETSPEYDRTPTTSPVTPQANGDGTYTYRDDSGNAWDSIIDQAAVDAAAQSAALSAAEAVFEQSISEALRGGSSALFVALDSAKSTYDSAVELVNSPASQTFEFGDASTLTTEAILTDVRGPALIEVYGEGAPEGDESISISVDGSVVLSAVELSPTTTSSLPLVISGTTDIQVAYVAGGPGGPSEKWTVTIKKV